MLCSFLTTFLVDDVGPYFGPLAFNCENGRPSRAGRSENREVAGLYATYERGNLACASSKILRHKVLEPILTATRFIC